jgi:hypothetical protein
VGDDFFCTCHPGAFIDIEDYYLTTHFSERAWKALSSNLTLFHTLHQRLSALVYEAPQYNEYDLCEEIMVKR